LDYKKYERVKLKAKKNDGFAEKFSEKVNNLPEDVRLYTLYQLDKNPARLVVKYFILGILCDGSVDESVRDMIKQWNLSYEEYRHIIEEMIEENLIEPDVDIKEMITWVISFVNKGWMQLKKLILEHTRQVAIQKGYDLSALSDKELEGWLNEAIFNHPLIQSIEKSPRLKKKLEKKSGSLVPHIETLIREGKIKSADDMVKAMERDFPKLHKRIYKINRKL